MLLLDEGFGSLDAEALDKAADALLGLAAAGRMVGAVSHVPGLEARLALRLRVSPGRDGPAVAWEGA
jgi:exonuclease SbcC